MLDLFARTCAVALLSLLAPQGVAQLERTIDWKPIDPAEIALETPKVQADADAEALFWDVHVSDQQHPSSGELMTVLDHYVRIKIFTDRGRERYATVNIGHDADTQVMNVAARTIKRDGTIV